MVLTDRQRNALENAILEYLKENEYTTAYDAMAECVSNITPPRQSKYLEKKWTTVMKLEKKIQEMEKTIAELTEELKNSNPMSNVFQSKKSTQSVPQNLRCQLKGHRQAITHVAFHPTFGVVVSSSEDATLRIWQPDTGQVERVLKGHTDSVNHFDFHPEGTQLASCSSDLSIKVWDFTSDFRCLRTLTGHENTVSRVVFCEGGAKIVSCSKDFSIRVWETDTGYCTNTLQGHTDWVRVLCSSPGGSKLASASLDKSIIIWDSSSGNMLNEIRDYEQHIECLAFGSRATDNALGREEELDGEESSGYEPQLLAVGSRDRSVRLYDIESGECLMNLAGHNNWVRALTFHPNGKFLISVSDDGSIRVWDLQKQRTFWTKDKAHASFIQTCAWNPSLPMFATAGADKTVKVWECI